MTKEEFLKIAELLYDLANGTPKQDVYRPFIPIKKQPSDNSRYEYTDTWTTTGTGEISACDNCPTNPKNGGDGLCLCTLGSLDIKC